MRHVVAHLFVKEAITRTGVSEVTFAIGLQIKLPPVTTTGVARSFD